MKLVASSSPPQRPNRGGSSAARWAMIGLFLFLFVVVLTIAYASSSSEQDKIETSQIGNLLTTAKKKFMRYFSSTTQRLDDEDNDNTRDAYEKRRIKLPRNPTTPPPVPFREPRDAGFFKQLESEAKTLDDAESVAKLAISNHSGAPWTQIGRLVMSRVPKMCSKNWDHELMMRFEERCGYWSDVLGEWDSRPAPEGRGAATYLCLNEKMCNGLGDRLAGMMGALSLAVGFLSALLEAARGAETRRIDAREAWMEQRCGTIAPSECTFRGCLLSSPSRACCAASGRLGPRTTP